MKKPFAVITAVIFAVLMLAGTAIAEENPASSVPTPEGYNDHDFQKVVSFLMQEDADGVTNGCHLYGANYDPSADIPGQWNSEGRLTKLWLLPDDEQISGDLNLDGCTALYDLVVWANGLSSVSVADCTALELLELDREGTTGTVRSINVSGCTALRSIYAAYEKLTGIDVAGCVSLEYLVVSSNDISQLDVSNCTELVGLNCAFNDLNELDVTACKKLKELHCQGNHLKQLDLSGIKQPVFIAECGGLELIKCLDKTFTKVGGGTIGISFDEYLRLFAEPDAGESFIGWFDGNGEPIGTNPSASYSYFADRPIVTAVFTDNGETPAEPSPVDPPKTGGPSAAALGAAAVLFGAGCIALRKKH